MSVVTFPIVLEDTVMLSPSVKHFVFKATNTDQFDYIPGQFITIHFDCQGTLLRRSYSIANIHRQGNRLEFSAGYVEGGPGTALLFNLKVGDTLDASGPYGRLVLKDPCPKRYILVATSTGVTPYRAMLQQLKQKLDQEALESVVIMLGVRSQEEALFLDEFLAFAKDRPQVTILMCYSRPNETALQPYERHGYVQTFFAELSPNPDTDQVYLCGRPTMIDDAFERLKAAGLTPQQIVREKYISR